MKEFINKVIDTIEVIESDWIGKGYFWMARLLVFCIIGITGFFFWIIAGSYSYWPLCVTVMLFIAHFNDGKYSYFSGIKSMYECIKFIFGDISVKFLALYVMCQCVLFMAAIYGMVCFDNCFFNKSYSIYFCIFLFAVNSIFIFKFVYIIYFDKTNEVQFERMKFLRWMIGSVVAFLICIDSMHSNRSGQNIIMFINTVFALFLMLGRMRDSYSKIKTLLQKNY